MKRLVVLLLLLFMNVGVTIAYASDMEVQIISTGKPEEIVPSTLDDIQVKSAVEIPGYASITVLNFQWMDAYVYLNETNNSGVEADYAVFRFDMLNLMKESTDYVSTTSVKVIFKDKYEFSGEIWQYDYNTSDKHALHPKQVFPIDPFFAGHFDVVCKIPNLAVTSKEPLRLVIQLGPHEIIYNIRK